MCFRKLHVVLLIMIDYFSGSFAAQHQIVYVSKVHGYDFSGCGSIAHPCKSLQLGFDVLAPGGYLYVDGEATKLDPYSCQSSGGKLLVQKGFTMLSYIKTAHVSCSNGIRIQPDIFMKVNGRRVSPIRLYANPEKTVILNGIHFKKTTIALEDATAVIKDCVFAEGSMVINVTMSLRMPVLTLNVSNTRFKKNQGCIQVYSESIYGCNTVKLNLQNVVFTENSGNPRALIQVNGTTKTSSSTYSFIHTMQNVTIFNNNALVPHKSANVERETKRRSFVEKSGRKGHPARIREANFLEIQAHKVNLQFTNIKSEDNSNMRFLSLYSSYSYVNITNSSIHGNRVKKSGGVMYITSPKGKEAVIRVIVERSKFSNNVAGESGGLLHVDGRKNSAVYLRIIDTSIRYSYGLVTGCAISMGRMSKRFPVSVPGKLYVKLEGLVFQHCSAPCDKHKKRQCQRSRLGNLCFNAVISVQVFVKNSKFSHNFNKYESILSIRHKNIDISGVHSNRMLYVYIENTTFTKNTSPRKVAIVLVKDTFYHLLKNSTLMILNSRFSENSGQAIEANTLERLHVENFTCINNNGWCLEVENANINHKSTKSFNLFVIIRNSLFENNTVPLVIRHTRPKYNNITIHKTIFRGNTFNEKEAIRITIGLDDCLKFNTCSLVSGSVTMDQVVFSGNVVNRASGSVFGIAIFPHRGQFKAYIRNSVFKDNFQKHKNDRPDISDLLYLYLPRSQIRYYNVTGSIDRCKAFRFPNYIYSDIVTFENVLFTNNTGYANIIYINHGKTIFRRCLFENNYSHHPRTSVVIFVEQGSPSVVFETSVFNQTQIRTYLHRNANDTQTLGVNIMPFIFFSGFGPLILRNSSLTVSASEIVTPIFIIQNARYVHLDKNTNLSCPVGSYIKLDNSSHLIPPRFTRFHCPMNITRLKYTCRRCPVSQYSLERGILSGKELKKNWIVCFKCPFGGDCMDNIISRRSFWGYKEQQKPPKLKFEHCPENYCLSPTSTDPAVYNHCHGNRTGIMCGSCQKGFTESIFNHKCRPINECNDCWFWIIAGLYSIIMALYIMYQPSIVSYLMKKLFWFKEKDTVIPPPNSRVEQLKQLGGHTSHGYSKIVFYFYQITELLMLESCTEILRQEYFIAILISFYNFQVELVDDSMGCPFPGLNVVTKELFRSLQVFVVMAWIVVFYLIVYLLHLITNRPKPLVAPYIAAIVEVLLLGYERLGHTSLALLSCTPLKINGSTEWRLFLDGNITCWVDWWQYALIAYNIIFVVPFLVVLLIGTTKLRHQRTSPWMFVAACFVPLPFLVCWGIKWIVQQNKRKQNPNRSSSQLQFQTTFSLLEVIQGPFRSPDSQSRGALYWESVLIGRRLVLLCLRSFIAAPMFRLLCMAIVCIIVLVHNIIAHPYKERKANNFSIAAQLTIVIIAIINLSKASVIAAAVHPEGPLLRIMDGLQTFEIILLGILPAGLGMLITAVVISQTIRLVLAIKLKILRMKTKQVLGVSVNDDYHKPLLSTSTESLDD